MKIALTAIAVKDLSKSIKFYKDILGLEEIRRINPQEGIECVFLKDEEDVTIELVRNKNTSNTDDEQNKSIVSIAFNVNNLDETIEMLRNNAIEIIQGPIEVPGGVKLAFAVDPNGVNIEFIQGLNK